MMLEEEERWFAAQLRALPVVPSPCVDIGSGIARPVPGRTHLRNLLLESGVRVVNFDRKAAPEIDISGDIFDPAAQRRIAALAPRLIVCTNMLEHLPAGRIGEFARILTECLAPDGHLFISAPRSHPYHLDPIDNRYRPHPEELAGLFPDLRLVAAASVSGPSYWDELRQSDRAYYWRVARRLLKPVPKFDRWKATIHRFGWLRRPYVESCLVLHKAAD